MTHSQTYDLQRPTACEELNVRAVHRGQNRMLKIFVAVGITVDNTAQQRSLHKLDRRITPENFVTPCTNTLYSTVIPFVLIEFVSDSKRKFG